MFSENTVPKQELNSEETGNNSFKNEKSWVCNSLPLLPSCLVRISARDAEPWEDPSENGWLQQGISGPCCSGDMCGAGSSSCWHRRFISGHSNCSCSWSFWACSSYRDQRAADPQSLYRVARHHSESVAEQAAGLQGTWRQLETSSWSASNDPRLENWEEGVVRGLSTQSEPNALARSFECQPVWQGGDCYWPCQAHRTLQRWRREAGGRHGLSERWYRNRTKKETSFRIGKGSIANIFDISPFSDFIFRHILIYMYTIYIYVCMYVYIFIYIFYFRRSEYIYI